MYYVIGRTKKGLYRLVDIFVNIETTDVHIQVIPVDIDNKTLTEYVLQGLLGNMEYMHGRLDCSSCAITKIPYVEDTYRKPTWFLLCQYEKQGRMGYMASTADGAKIYWMPYEYVCVNTQQFCNISKKQPYAQRIITKKQTELPIISFKCIKQVLHPREVQRLINTLKQDTGIIQGVDDIKTKERIDLKVATEYILREHELQQKNQGANTQVMNRFCK